MCESFTDGSGWDEWIREGEGGEDATLQAERIESCIK